MSVNPRLAIGMKTSLFLIQHRAMKTYGDVDENIILK